MKNRKLIYILAIIAIIILIIFVKNKSNNSQEEIGQNINIEEREQEEIVLAEYVQELEDGTLKNNSEKFKENKKNDGLEITRVRITAEEDTKIALDIKNISSTTKGNKDVTLVMKDKSGEEIGKIGVFISEIKPNNSITLELNVDKNYINTYDFEILNEELTIE